MNIDTSVVGITIPQGAAKNIKRSTEMLWQDGGLPTAFQRCEYIESHGTEAILLSHSPLDTDEVGISYFDLTSKSSQQSLFGVYDGINFVFAAMNASTLRIFVGGAVNIDRYTDHASVYFSYKNGKARIFGDLSVQEISYDRLPSSNIALFTQWNKTYFSTAKASYKLEKFYGKLDGNYVYHLIPCYLKTAWNGIPAGTIGLYDLCGSISSNGTPFYTNEGTGAFTKGPDVT